MSSPIKCILFVSADLYQPGVCVVFFLLFFASYGTRFLAFPLLREVVNV